MSQLFNWPLVIVIMLFWANTPAFAAKWITVDEKTTANYQVDTETIEFSGGDNDKQLEVWMKTVEKNGSGSYMLSHYLVRENLNFILKERTTYSISGQVMDSFHNNNLDKWTVTTQNSPIGAIAVRLFADYRKNPESFKNKITANDALFDPALKNDLPESGQRVINPQELQQAIADNRIKNGQNKDGTKWFYVRDTWTAYHFLNKEHMTADFWLITGPSTKYSRFNFSFSDDRAGSHTLKEAVTIRIDNKEWVLAQQMAPGATNFPTAMFNYSFLIPDSLLQALLTTSSDITVKWKHSWGGWRDYDYTIPAKVVRDIQLMYAGCK